MGSSIRETHGKQYMTYALEMEGKLYVVEHLSDKVCA